MHVHAVKHRSLDYSESLDRVVIGTNHCDVKELAGEDVVCVDRI